MIKGKGNAGLALEDTITRAEMVTIIVRAFGHEDNAAQFKGSSTFPDTGKHWASGYITVANKLIIENGYQMGLPNWVFLEGLLTFLATFNSL